MTDIIRLLLLTIAFVTMELFFPSSGHAQGPQSLSIELNKLEPVDEACRFTFVVTNAIQVDLDKLAFEVVLFDKQGGVKHMTKFDFQETPSGKTRVRQFQLPETDCRDISRFLMNSVSSCTAGSAEIDGCSQKILLKNRTEIEFIN
ncbi:MAG: hypothetical protein AAFN43_00985 [Pseudomonadota bacterium]